MKQRPDYIARAEFKKRKKERMNQLLSIESLKSPLNIHMEVNIEEHYK